MDPDDCVFRDGDVGLLLGDGLIRHPSGTLCEQKESQFELGSGFRFYYGDTMEPEQPSHPSHPSQPAHAEPVAQEAQTVEPSSPTTSELAGLAQATGGDSTLTILLALIAVVGGAAGWKFWNKLSEQKHEQAMKRLEMEAAAKGVGAAQPPPCQAAQAKIEAEIDGLKGRVSGVEKKATSISADFDAEDIERQLKKLNKAVKALQDGS